MGLLSVYTLTRGRGMTPTDLSTDSWLARIMKDFGGACGVMSMASFVREVATQTSIPRAEAEARIRRLIASRPLDFRIDDTQEDGRVEVHVNIGGRWQV